MVREKKSIVTFQMSFEMGWMINNYLADMRCKRSAAASEQCEKSLLFLVMNLLKNPKDFVPIFYSQGKYPKDKYHSVSERWIVLTLLLPSIEKSFTNLWLCC